VTPAFRNCLALTGVATVALTSANAVAKRLPPADVPPVTSGNVRYEAPHSANPCNQNGGCVVAYDDTTNAVLWSVKVYCTHYDTSLETDVQDVFITSLAVANGQVLVTDEKGRHFAIDPATQQVTGDARGCDGVTSGGCSYLALRSRPTAGWLVGALGALGFAGILLGRRRS
jgi:outer membrane protein assembly factor BamB